MKYLYRFIAYWSTLLLQGGIGIPLHPRKAFVLASIGAKKGCSACIGVLARCYYNGYGCTKDETHAVQLAKKSALSGNHFGFFVLAWKSYDDGDQKKAAQLWQISAEHGLAAAQVCLAYLYANGEGVEKNEQKAFQLYQMAADQEYPEGYLNLSRMYLLGIGVESDIDKASRYAQLTRQAGISKWLTT